MMNGLIFQWPLALLLLLLLIPLVWLHAFANQAREQVIRALGGEYHTHRRFRDSLRLLALALLILSLARPGHSPRTESVSHMGRDVVFALDVSRSMLAEDLTPSRLEVAKQAIRDALAGFHHERVGLVVYAGSASILCPLSYDHDFVRYMLEQANPRSVDFGGTTLQSAVDKVVDQVFIEGRAGVQDLIVLTDGGDHGSKMSAVVKQLNDYEVDVLIVGLGDAQIRSPIPIIDEEGNPGLLQTDGVTVYTKLDDTVLRDFAAQSGRVLYVPAGTSPFNLGQLYATYAADKSVQPASSESGIQVYQESFAFFLIPALVLLLIAECIGAKGLRLGTAILMIMFLIPSSHRLRAASAGFESDFDVAYRLLESGNVQEAEIHFTDMYREAREGSANAAELAAVQMNRGLCLIQLSQAQGEENPELALGLAQEAQIALLSAKRYNPLMQRAGLRLQNANTLISRFEAKLEAMENAEQVFNERFSQLIEQIQILLKKQKALRETTISQDVDRRRPRTPKKAPPPPPIIPPENAAELGSSFQEQQNELHKETLQTYEFMSALNSELAAGASSEPTGTQTILHEPLQLMNEVLAAQQQAETLFAAWSSWPAGRGEQQVAERLLKRILDLLGGNSNPDLSDAEDYDDSEYEENEYMEDSEESLSSSESIEGELAMQSEMQELPVPNYSAEEILLEEQGNLQFRQQKRASANAAKVKKDY